MNNTESSLQLRGELTIGWCAAAAAMLVVIITTLVANLVVLLALRRIPRAPAHYPLASLATADLLVAVFVAPLAASRDIFVFPLNSVLCACWKTLDVMCSTASILSICVLGWERCCAITAPLDRARHGRARRLAGLVWLVSAIIALPTAFVPSSAPVHWHDGQPIKACSVNTNVGYVFSSIVFSFYIPVVGMVVLYERILRALSAPPLIRAHRGRTPHAAPKSHCTMPTGRCLSPIPVVDNNNAAIPATDCISEGLLLRQRRAFRVIVTLMTLFLICWLPFFIMLPVDSLCNCVADAVFEWCLWLGYVNSALNPMVYAAASPSVRRALHASFASTGSRNIEIPLTPHVRRA